MDVAEWLERPTANSIPASPDTEESEGCQMKQWWMKYFKKSFKNQHESVSSYFVKAEL